MHPTLAPLDRHASATIRLATAEDAGPILEIYSPFCRDTFITFETEPPSLEEMRARIESKGSFYPWLVCEGAEILGFARATQHRERAAYQWAADVSIYVASGHRGRGLGKALYTSLVAILKLQGLLRICAGIALPNPASVALHEALGFQSVGIFPSIGYKLGSWRDVGWWQLMLGATDNHPPLPIPVGRIASRELSVAFAAGQAILQ
jgi:phosphinothricin acetyltransferase